MITLWQMNTLTFYRFFLKATAAMVVLATVVPRLAPAAEVELIEIVEVKVAQENAGRFVLGIEQFNQWIFGSQLTLKEAKQQLLDRLQAECDSVDAAVQLADQQKKRLLLAGRGDLRAFTRQYAKIRDKYDEKLHGRQIGQEAWQEMWQELHPLKETYQRQIYAEGSLFQKVLNHLLDDQQSARIEQLRREQRKFQYQAAIMQLISQLDQAAPMTNEKRKKLLALIEQHTLPPKAISGANRNHYLMYFVLSQMPEIPEDELRPLFKDAAWKIVKKQMTRGVRMRGQLEALGMVPEEK